MNDKSYIDPCAGDQVSIEIQSPNLDAKLDKEFQKTLPSQKYQDLGANPVSNIEQEILASRQIEPPQVLDTGKSSYTSHAVDKADEITLSFKNLSYSVQVKNSKKDKKKKVEMQELLKGITGICKPKELTAIMGASGAGKTTLLNILSLRVSSKGKKNKLSGEYLANGKPYNTHTFSKFAGYVMQNDILLATMTPREVFEFTAHLRLHVTGEERKRKVNQLIQDLQLERAADTMVGDTLSKGISGGERKRTSIGVELMTDPNLLFLDEPTSGLDSFTAFRLINLLKNLAARDGKAIVFTIHQPSTDVFFMFDKLMILAKGKFIYQGQAQQAIHYFENIGYPCPEYSNPADHFIQIAHDGDDEKFEAMYKEYDEKLAPTIEQEVQNLQKGELRLHEKVSGFFVSSGVVAKRSFRNYVRNPILFKGRIVQTIFITFLICCIYFQIPKKNAADEENPITGVSQAIYDINGALFFFSISLFAMSCMSVVLTFPTERCVFLKEYSSNMYSVSAYFFGRSSTELPFVILFPVIMTAISYYIIGFNSGVGNFFCFMLILVCVSVAGNAVGLLAGSIFSDPKVASNVAPAFMLPMMLFAGFYINADSMPVWLGWLQYLSVFRYSLEAFMWNEYSGSTFGTLQLTKYNYTLGLWPAFVLLVVVGLGFRILALISLKLLVRRLQ